MKKIVSIFTAMLATFVLSLCLTGCGGHNAHHHAAPANNQESSMPNYNDFHMDDDMVAKPADNVGSVGDVKKPNGNIEYR